MKSTSHRFMLREVTRDQHERLDAEIGDLASRTDYIRYLGGMLVFRSAIEIHLGRVTYPAAFGLWRPRTIAGELRLDLNDLGVMSRRSLPDFMDFGVGASALLGVLYVTEGSALGARLLARRAEAIGFTAGHGARHLHAQMEDSSSWTTFQDILQSTEAFDMEAAARSAGMTFELAYQAFRQVAHAELYG